MIICGQDIRIQGRLIRIARLELDKYEFLDDPEATVEGLRNCGTRVDLFTFLQRLPENLQTTPASPPCYKYPIEWDNLAALPISTFDHWWTQQIRNGPRGRVRQAEKKGVTVREMPFDDVLVRGIWEIYNECPVRQGKLFTHYGEDIETVRRGVATFPDRSIFAGAFLGERMIGFIKLVTDERRTQACLMHIVSMVQHKDRAPTNALIAEAVRSCARRNIPYLVYQNFAYGKKQRDSLSDFKERNGFQRVDLPRYYVPLTAIGWAALRLGLHRKLADRLPESVLSRLRELRTTWNNRKLQSAPEVS